LWLLFTEDESILSLSFQDSKKGKDNVTLNPGSIKTRSSGFQLLIFRHSQQQINTLVGEDIVGRSWFSSNVTIFPVCTDSLTKQWVLQMTPS
jgi:hypothetical protein